MKCLFFELNDYQTWCQYNYASLNWNLKPRNFVWDVPPHCWAVHIPLCCSCWYFHVFWMPINVDMFVILNSAFCLCVNRLFSMAEIQSMSTWKQDCGQHFFNVSLYLYCILHVFYPPIFFVKLVNFAIWLFTTMDM